MGKFIAIVAAFISFLVFAGIASVNTGANFDYANAEAEQRQRFLDGIADGFKTGFKLTAGKSAEVTQVFADESVDLVSISIQYRDERINDVPVDFIEKQRLLMTKKGCQLAQKQKILDMGVTMRVRFYKPSGLQMGTVQVDEDACDQYIA